MNDTFWMHDFFLDPNNQDIDPFISKHKEHIPINVAANIWRPWVQDIQSDYERMLSIDMNRLQDEKESKEMN